MTLQVPKGTRDLAGSDVLSFTELETVARRVFELFQFNEIRTPIFEAVELFSRSLGETSDVVEKEMFTFTDRGERTFALRPEGTAGVVRHFIENNLAVKGGVHRLFYVGPMFRAERPQAGRYRQFWQIGSEYFGPADAMADAETVILAAKIFRDFGVTDFTVHVNSIGDNECRPKYREALSAYLKKKEKDLTEESRRRMLINPMRVLDSKVDGPKLADAPLMKDFLNDVCRRHHQEFTDLLRAAQLTVVENPRLVRGLDYYSKSVFEFVSPVLGAQSALAAGGRYDDLVPLLGGPSMPAVGFALGMDRVVTAREKAKSPPVSAVNRPLAVIVPMTDQANGPGFSLAQHLRTAGVRVPPLLPGKKLKNQLSYAVDMGANWAILIGEDELKANTVTLKNLATRDQEQISKELLISKLRG